MSALRLQLDLDAKKLVKHPDFGIVLTVLKGNSRVSEHEAGGRISIQTVRGRIRMRVSHPGAEETIDLPAGHLIALDRNLRHDVEAEVDSAFLLTLAWPEGGETEVSNRRALGGREVA